MISIGFYSLLQSMFLLFVFFLFSCSSSSACFVMKLIICVASNYDIAQIYLYIKYKDYWTWTFFFVRLLLLWVYKFFFIFHLRGFFVYRMGTMGIWMGVQRFHFEWRTFAWLIYIIYHCEKDNKAKRGDRTKKKIIDINWSCFLPFTSIARCRYNNNGGLQHIWQ